MLRLSTHSFAFTPTYPMPLAGYGHRAWAYEKIDQDLEAIFLLLSDDGGGEVVLGSVDTLFLTPRLLSDLQDSLGNISIPLCLFATHTHNAPSLAPDLPLLGRHDPALYQSFVSTCARAIGELVGSPPELVVPQYGERLTTLNVNRRRPSWVMDYSALVRGRGVDFGRRVSLAANKRGVVDHRVRAIFFEDQNGDVQGVVWTLAAHPAFYPASYRVSPDYPGLIRERLRQHFGPNCAVVYLPGFAGSAIPNIPPRLATTPKAAVISLLPFYPVLRTFDESGYRKWVDCLFLEILHAYDARNLGALETSVAVDSTSVPGIFVGCNNSSESAHIDLHVARVMLAADLEILAFNGEMLCEWMPLLQRACGGTVLFSGYLAGEPLYVPTSSQIPEGGYEVTGFQRLFGLDGVFHPEISRLVVSAIEGLYARRRS